MANRQPRALGIILTWIGLRRHISLLPVGRRLLAAFALVGIVSYEIYLFHQPLVRDYNLYAYHVLLKVAAPTHYQLLAGIFVGLGATVVISVVVHVAVNRAFRFLRPRTSLGQPHSR